VRRSSPLLITDYISFGGCDLRDTVRWFNNSKGFGFIGRGDVPDVFVHYAIVGSSRADFGT